MAALSFGKRQRIKFIAAGTLDTWQPPVTPALYAVTYKQDPDARPKSHTVLFFGQADDLSIQAQSINSQVGNWWDRHGGRPAELFVFYHPLPGSNGSERRLLQEQLVAEYDPQGNSSS